MPKPKVKHIRVLDDRVAPDFWEILRWRRQDLELSQREVGQHVGVHGSTICIWELRGLKRLPSPRKFWSIAEVLDLSDEEMLEAAGYLRHRHHQVAPLSARG